jgi:splicing factor U2AF 65 kDa subunit
VRHLKNWDVAPAGFERIGADKAKLTGLFPPPGNIAKSANYVPPTLDPARAAMLQLLNKDNINMRDTTTASSDFSNGNTSSSIPANLQKQAKRFYVGNLPVSISESALMAFLESNLASLSGTTRNQVAPISQENRVMSINISTDRSYAFVDCRTAEDASLAMNLDGVLLESSQLKIRRPKEYHVAITSGLISNANNNNNNNNSSSNDKSASSFADATDSSTSTTCCINRRQLVISGIPDILTGEHIRSLLLLVAELRSFLLLRDRKTDKSLGVAIFEFIEDSPEVENWTAPFLKHTKGRIFMGPFEMKLARVIDLIDDAEELEITSQEQELEDSSSSAVFDEKEKLHLQSLLSLYNLQPGYATAPSSTPVLQILNIVTPQSLQSDYEAIRSDLIDELKKFCHGEEEKFELTIPQYAEPGAGKVYVKYAKIEEAARAAREISGRIFDGHTCIVSFYPPEKYEKRIF